MVPLGGGICKAFGTRMGRHGVGTRWKVSIMTSKWELSPPGGSISELQAKFPGGNVVFITIKYNFQTNNGGLGNTICNHKPEGI